MSILRPTCHAPSAPDAEALLVALVLDPATYSRNRFFELYSDPAVRRVRRRAALVRSLLRHLARRTPDQRGQPFETETTEGGAVNLSYTVPRLGLRRTTRLEPLELSLVRFGVARAEGRNLPADDADRVRVEAALRCLADPIVPRAAPSRPTPTPPPPTTGTGA
jgi:hypothetical protein